MPNEGPTRGRYNGAGNIILSSKGSMTVWALHAYFSDSQNAAFELLVWYI